MASPSLVLVPRPSQVSGLSSLHDESFSSLSRWLSLVLGRVMISQILRYIPVCIPRRITASRGLNPRAFASRKTRCFSNDPYQFYRDPSAELWRHIEREHKRTLPPIDSKLKLEIERNIQNQSPASTPELGPSGRYFYRTSDGSDDRLRYFRSVNAEESDADDILILNLNEYELKAMSLSVDESFLAYLISFVESLHDTELWVKDLRSKNTLLVPIKGKNLALAEWGPCKRMGCTVCSSLQLMIGIDPTRYLRVLSPTQRFLNQYKCTTTQTRQLSWTYSEPRAANALPSLRPPRRPMKFTS